MPAGSPLISKLPSALADGEERVREDAAVGRHPAVDVAAEGHHHFRLVEHPRRLHALDRLAEIELGVDLGHRVDVVERRVAVEDDHRLSDLRPEDVRRVLAPLLVEHDGRFRSLERAVAETILHVHEGVLETVARADDEDFRGRRAFGHAQGIGIHADNPRFLGGAFVLDGPGNRALTRQRRWRGSCWLWRSRG